MLKYPTTHTFNPEILRAYDIRGIYGKTLTEKDAWSLGIAFGYYVRHHNGKTVAVARDGRLSSPSLNQALIQGLREQGIAVADLGVGPTPLLYFGVQALNRDGGVMITGSHNPAEHNGFKLCLKDCPFYGQNIQDLPVFLSQAFDQPEPLGAVTSVNLLDVYVERLLQEINPTFIRDAHMYIAWDPGNGATGEVIKRLADRLPARHHFLNMEIDGTFPAHHPDPSNPETLTQLIETVQRLGATLGIAFDGDGDRLGVVDHKGRILTSEDLMMIFLEDVLKNHPQGKIMYDIKTTNAVRDKIQALGGAPLMWKTGHATIKANMNKEGAIFAGEVSGHMFFKDNYYGFDDGMYAAVRLLKIISQNPQWLDFKDLPPSYYQTPEILVPCSNEKKFEIVREVKRGLDHNHVPYNDLDGVRVETSEGWWLLRASNTQDLIMMRCESYSSVGLQKIQQEMESYLQGLIDLKK